MTHDDDTPQEPMRFRALWPVIDEHADPYALLTEAHDDLPRVARLHGARRVLAIHTTAIRLGRHVPGSAGARLVVVIDATVEPTARTANRTRNQPRTPGHTVQDA